MEKIKRKVDDETIVLERLKQTAEAQSSLSALKEQCSKELSDLEESIKEEAYSLGKFGMQVETPLPRDGDETGEQLSKEIESKMEAARERFTAAISNLERATDDATNSQKIVSEKTALLAGNQKSLTTVRARLQELEPSVSKMKQLVQELREHEAEQRRTLPADEYTPGELIKYIEERLDDLEDDAPDANYSKTAKKVLKKLRTMVRLIVVAWGSNF